MKLFVESVIAWLVYVIIRSLLARMFQHDWMSETDSAICNSTKMVGTASLNVKQLKHLLDVRGVSYDSDWVIEKGDLVQLVNKTGRILEQEVLLMEHDAAEDEAETMTTKFQTGTQLELYLRNSDDSVWFVQIIPQKHGPLRKKDWSAVVKKLSRFGIQLGTFNCSNSPRYCAKNSWTMPLILVNMPKVGMTTFSSAKKAMKFVYSQLASQVQTMRGFKDFDWDKLQSYGGFLLKLVLFSRNPEPQALFSALNFKYSLSGRVKFIFVTDSGVSHVIHKQSQTYRIPSFVVFTPEGRKIYGENNCEYYTYDALDKYIQDHLAFFDQIITRLKKYDTIFPTLINVNIVCFISIFVTQGNVARRLCRFLWTTGKYNLCYIVLLASLISILDTFPLTVEDFLCMMPALSTKLAWLLAWLVELSQDWTIYYSGHIIITPFLLYCVGVNWIFQQIHTPTFEEQMTSIMWLRAAVVNLDPGTDRLREFHRNRPPGQRASAEEIMAFLNQRENEMNAQAHVDLNYIENLQAWRYRAPGGDPEHTDPWPRGIFFHTECSICLGAYENGDVLRGLPCSHAYHEECIFAWLKQDKHSCPLCRWPAYKSMNRWFSMLESNRVIPVILVIAICIEYFSF